MLTHLRRVSARVFALVASAGIAVLLAPSTLLARAQPTSAPAAPTAPANTTPPAAAPRPAVSEWWRGELIVGEDKMIFGIAINRSGDKPMAYMTIPSENLKDGELRDVELSATKFKFCLARPGRPESDWARIDMDLAADGNSAAGFSTQSGSKLPVSVRRTTSDDRLEPNRPQTPKAPFPYVQRDVSYENLADHAKLAGTLTIPEVATFGKGPHPAVILITGSGPQDRDETIFFHKPFAVLADHLTRAGVAVLRVDDRGVGGSTSPKAGLETTDDFAADVAAGVAFLRQQPEIDPKRVGLIGHSEGGIIAPMVAAKDSQIAFIVLLAGPGVNGQELLRTQVRASGLAGGTPMEQVDAIAPLHAKLIKLASEKAPEADLRAAIVRTALAQMGLDPEGPIPPELAAPFAAGVDGQLKMLTSPWMQRFLTLDPREYLRKTKCPVLAINGGNDTQVVAGQNLFEIRQALKVAGNNNATVEVMPNLNHLFQTSKSGSLAEYNRIEETIAPSVLEKISTWVRKQTGVQK